MVTRIPENARVIEWWDGHAQHVALRHSPLGMWFLAGDNEAYGSHELLGYIGRASAKALAHFPEPTLEEIVGDASTFLADHADGTYTPLIGHVVRRHGDKWWMLVDLRSLTCLTEEGAQLADLARHVDLSSVVPLAPRGKG